MITDMEPVARSRETRQRALVYAIVASTESHPTADWVYARAREAMPRVSLGTVYRNLQRLAADGRIRAIDAWGKTTRWDADLSAHHHFVCTGCGLIHDVPKPEGEDARLAASLRLPGFTITGHRLELEGLCRSCAPGSGGRRPRVIARSREDGSRSAKRIRKEKPCPP
jgi:Fe2+ or Zn2+ uptake regulation protein